LPLKMLGSFRPLIKNELGLMAKLPAP